MMLCQSPTLPHSSSIPESMEYVNYEPEFNPEAITNYYSTGVQIGRCKNPDIKEKIIKAKSHLSALGWKFFYIHKKASRKELRYRSPEGKTYISLRTACQSLINHQDHHNVDVGKSIIKEVANQETEVEKKEECMISNRPTKRIRIEDVESSYFRQKCEESVNSNDLVILKDEKDEQEKGIFKNRQGKVLKLMESGKKRNMIKPKKETRKANPSTTSRRCMLSLLIQRGIVLSGSRVAYLNRLDDHVMAQGRVYEEGILCDCCNEYFLLSKFETHAGSTYRRPAARIFLDDGRSLLDCQTQLNLENEVCRVTKSTEAEACDRLKGQDEFCSFCNDGGELLLCDSCTSSYHSSCIGLDGVPDSEYWFCPSCCCGICQKGQISQDSPDHPQIKCEQCELQFHIDCLKKEGVKLSSDDTKKFCSEKCGRIFSGLMGISGVSIPLSTENLSWRLLKLVTDDKEEYTKTYRKLNVALEVMHECFEPVQHAWSNNDVVEDVIFGRSTKKTNFKGFYTAVLESDEEVITAITVRVHGCKMAEIPFVGTRFLYRRLGMCRVLMDELERKLGELGVERLVLPAVPDMVSTWTQAFGFKMMTDAERLSLVECRFLDFPGTIKCQKILKTM